MTKFLAEFYIAGTPIRQPRQRYRIVKPKGRTPFVQGYVPQSDKVHAWKAIVKTDAQLFIRHNEMEMINFPISIDMVFVMPRPTSRTRKTMPNDRYWHAQTPDVDNLTKAVWDALNGHLFKDDALIVKSTQAAFVAGDGDLPGVAIRVTEAGDIGTWADGMIHEGREQLF